LPGLPFRKKKKKDLPKPPSLTDFDEAELSGPPKLPPIPQPKISSESTPHQAPSSLEHTSPPPRTIPSQEYQGPPSTPVPPSLSAPPSLGIPPSFEPPPILSQDILSRPPFPEPPSRPSFVEKETPILENNLTSDILHELRQTGFGSDLLQHIPREKAPPISVDEVTRKEFEDAKVAYLEAGNKHLELSFYENAAVNLSCAVLCVFLGEGVYEASEMMAKLASGLHSAVINSYFFQGVRLLLKSNLTNSTTFFAQAEKWLLKEAEYLYKEDMELIRRAIRQTKKNLKIG
jgi:hypothetical protein